ncbi:MAG: hypothetical protein Q8L51_01340 [Candidatus Amesbacteria bacterium]|nr:hypothetical protein [Candidatus Amesbacteria bacterium]
MKIFGWIGKFIWWIVKSIIGFVVMNVVITVLVIVLVWKFVLPHTPDGYQPSVSEIQTAYQTFSDLSSGKTKLTKEQEIKLAPLATDIYNPANLAKALNIIDPVTFKNTDYWTALLTKLVPLYSRLLPSTE